jgi:hypothetical protein
VTIPDYPEIADVCVAQRPVLHPRFQRLPEGISELTFGGIFLFRDVHRYQVSRIDDDLYIIAGRDAAPFFMLPFGLPGPDILRALFERFATLKCAAAAQADRLAGMGYRVWEDRGNFDYLYRRQQRSPGDYAAAREALERMEELQLCGGIFYVDGRPIAYSLGEELAAGRAFVIHFEKAVLDEQYKGVYQYINQAFAAVLPEKYEWINREQDLGDAGLRQAKESYKPAGFVRKYRAAP